MQWVLPLKLVCSNAEHFPSAISRARLEGTVQIQACKSKKSSAELPVNRMQSSISALNIFGDIYVLIPWEN